MQNSSFDKWAETYKLFEKEGTGLLWPSETLLRLFKGDYVTGLNKDYAGKSVLDIGFGNGNNLVFLGSLGLQLSGVEVHDSICQNVSSKLQVLGYSSELRVGKNTQLPFADNTFDFLVSWNVIHYEDNEADILRAIAEYSRVLIPGGRFFVSTTGPDHKILLNSTTQGPHRYLIGREDDFRKGQVFYYFDTDEYVSRCFSSCFSDIMVGRTHDFLFRETLDWFIVTGLKPASC